MFICIAIYTFDRSLTMSLLLVKLCVSSELQCEKQYINKTVCCINMIHCSVYVLLEATYGKD